MIVLTTTEQPKIRDETIHQLKIRDATITRLEKIIDRRIMRGGDLAINEALDKLEGEKE